MSLSEYFVCYLQCLSGSGWHYFMLGITLLSLVLAVIFLIKRYALLMLGAQVCGTAVVLSNLLIMKCDMFFLVWVYLGMVFAFLFAFSFVRYLISRSLGDTIPSPKYVTRLAHLFDVTVKVLDTQRIKAFAYRKEIFLSVGLLERLDENETRAVVAHETYHVRSSPNRLISSTLALTSLTFFRYDDETQADRYAAEVAGKNHLTAALKKLDIKNWEKRMERL